MASKVKVTDNILVMHCFGGGSNQQFAIEGHLVINRVGFEEHLALST